MRTTEKGTAHPAAWATAVVGVGAAVVAVVLPQGPLDTSRESALRVAVLVLAVLAAGASLVLARRDRGENGRAMASLLLLAAAVLVGLVVVVYTERRSAGFISPGTPLAAVAAVAAGVAVAVVAWLPAQRLVAVVALVVVAALCVAVPWAAAEAQLTVSHEGTNPSADVPTTLTGVSWRYRPARPLATGPQPAGNGVVVATETSVVLINGATGEPAWTWERHGVSLRSLDVSADGQQVLVDTYLDHGRDHGPLVVLDADDGHEVRVLTDDGTMIAGALVTQDDDGRVRGVSVATGGTWSYAAPDGCRLGSIRVDLEAADAVRSVVPVLQWCDSGSDDPGAAEDDALVALDPDTGRPAWRHPLPPSTWFGDVDGITVHPSCGNVAVTRRSPEDGGTRGVTDLVDAEDGRSVATLRPRLTVTGTPECRAGHFLVGDEVAGDVRWVDASTGEVSATPPAPRFRASELDEGVATVRHRGGDPITLDFEDAAATDLREVFAPGAVVFTADSASGPLTPTLIGVG